jgi:hypothetical protein
MRNVFRLTLAASLLTASTALYGVGTSAPAAAADTCSVDEDDFLSAWEFMKTRNKDDCVWIMSRSTRYRLQLGGDGTLRFIDHWNNFTLWEKRFLAGSSIQLDGEGRLISYRPDGSGFYFSEKIVQGAVLKIQDDGKMVFYTPGFVPKAYNCKKTLPIRYDWCRV